MHMSIRYVLTILAYGEGKKPEGVSEARWKAMLRQLEVNPPQWDDHGVMHY
jgi:hypothetical protein